MLIKEKEQITKKKKEGKHTGVNWYLFIYVILGFEAGALRLPSTCSTT
jgi:hypothetical protein